MINLAILSPNQNAYSETFIQAHKKLPFNIKFYYGGNIPTYLEGSGCLLENQLFKIYATGRSKINTTFTRSELALKRSLKANKVQVVLAEYGITAAESLNVIKSLQIPLIVHFHGYDASNKDILLQYGETYKSVFEYASAIVVVSKQMYQQLILLGCPSQKLHLNYYGPHDDFLKIQPQFQKPQFISLGRFVDKKAPYLTLLAFKRVLEKHPTANLLMAGDGPLWDVCNNLIKVFGLSRNVKLIGIIDRKQAIELFSNSLAFVQHSIVAKNGDSEGTPVAIMEAQAAGLPVISTYHAGIPDIVIHEETGFLCKERDIDAMSGYMIKLLDEPQIAVALGIKAKERIKVDFTLNLHLTNLAKLVTKFTGV